MDPAALSREIDAMLTQPAASAPYFWFEGAPAADVVLRYEHLTDDLGALEARCGLVLVSNLPLTKHQSRHDRRPATEVLSEVQKRRCREVHRQEFELFGYAA